jgi:hypothetical protein
MKDYEIMTAGKATFTLTNGVDRRWTYRISKSKDGKAHFVSILTGADNTSDYTYLGLFKPENASVLLTKASQFKPESHPYRAINWLMKELQAERPLTHNFTVMWSDSCQRCGRELTVPSSIDNRIGPECAKKM